MSKKYGFVVGTKFSSQSCHCYVDETKSCNYILSQYIMPIMYLYCQRASDLLCHILCTTSNIPGIFNCDGIFRVCSYKCMENESKLVWTNKFLEICL